MADDNTTTSNRQRDTKISDFVGTTTIASADLITTVQNGTNKKMAASDFIAGLGVTGTIVQDGAVTGTPILDPQGTIYSIRNVEDGPGILSSVSAENGLKLEHNFSFDQTGVALTPDATTQAVVMRSVVGSANISVVASGDTVVLSTTRVDGLLSLQGNAVETVIAVATTPVLVAGVWVVGLESQMTGTVGGRSTLVATEDFTASIDAVLNMSCVSGGAKSLSAEIAINGTVIPASKMTASITGAADASIACAWQAVLSTSDYVEVFVTNETDTVNIIVSSAVLRIN